MERTPDREPVRRGYRQAGRDGLNAVVGTVTVTWEMLSIAQANYIENFFIAYIGQPSVEALHKRALLRLARRDIVPADTPLLRS